MSFADDYLDSAGPTGSPDRCVPPSGAGSPAAFFWVPIRSLSDRHRPRILAHFLALTQTDRYLRFGYAASDAQLAHYADTIDFVRDEVCGIFDRRLELVATAHLAMLLSPARDPHSQAEFGVSVLPKARGRGYGRRLFERAMLHARNRQVDTLVIHTLSDNAAMLHIVRSAGASIERDGGECQAWLRLPPDDLLSHMDAMVEYQAAELDYRFKWHLRRVDGLLAAIDEVRGGFANAGSTIGE